MEKEHYSFLIKELDWWIDTIPYYLRYNLPHQYGSIKRAYNISLVRALINGYIHEYIPKYEDPESKALLQHLYDFYLYAGQDMIRAITLTRNAKITNGLNDMELALERLIFIRDEIIVLMRYESGRYKKGKKVKNIPTITYVPPDDIKPILSTNLAIDSIYSKYMPVSVICIGNAMECLEYIDNKDLIFPILKRFANKLFNGGLETILDFKTDTTNESYYLMQHPIKGDDNNTIDVLIYAINNKPVYQYKVTNVSVFKSNFIKSWEHLID